MGRLVASTSVYYPASSLAASADDVEVLEAGMAVDMSLPEVGREEERQAVFASVRQLVDCRTVDSGYTRSSAAA